MEEKNISKEGYLYKQGGLMKTWKKRYFVLKNNALIYYKQKGDANHVGIIYLSAFCSVVDAQKKVGKANSFELRTKERDYYFYTELERYDFEEWKSTFAEVFAWAQLEERSTAGRDDFGDPSLSISLKEFHVHGMMCECCMEKVYEALDGLCPRSQIGLDLKNEKMSLMGCHASDDEVINRLLDAWFLSVLSFS